MGLLLALPLGVTQDLEWLLKLPGGREGGREEKREEGKKEGKEGGRMDGRKG